MKWIIVGGRKVEDLSGKQFGRLTALNVSSFSKNGGAVWACKCSCGKLKNVQAGHLKGGQIKSCGCLRSETAGNLRKSHGKSKTRLYRIWGDMKSRCNNPNTDNYSHYGMRGISVCFEWENNFLSFYTWAIGNGYADTKSIDRINVNGNYCPENCRWADIHTQSTNKTTNIYLTYNGEKMAVSEVAELIGVSPYTLYSRLNKLKWNPKEVVSVLPDFANASRRAQK